MITDRCRIGGKASHKGTYIFTKGEKSAIEDLKTKTDKNTADMVSVKTKVKL